MRVRQWAVVATAALGLLAGGVGTAQADDATQTGLPACGIAYLADADADAVPAPCGEVEVRTVAEVGCSGPGLLDVVVRGLDPTEKVRLVVTQGSTSNAFQPRPDGTIELYGTFEPDADAVAYEVRTEDGETVYRDVEGVEDVCRGTASLVVTGDCADPETVYFALSVTGLEPNSEYGVDYQSDGFVLNPGFSGNAIFFDTFTTDAQGAAEVRTKGTEDESVSISPGSFAVDFAVYGVDSGASSIEGHAQAEPCPTPGGTAPVSTTPVTTAPVVTAPVVAAPVVVPAAAHPAVLANTGTPVTAAALLGGGLVLAGAGALVATRRRAS